MTLGRGIRALRDLDLDLSPQELPRWFEIALAVAITAVGVFGLAGLALAMLGWYSVPLAALVAIAGSAAVGVLWCARTRGGGKRAAAAALLVVICVGLIGAFNAARSTDTLLGGRDPSVYVGTGLWLSSHDDLTLDSEREAFPRDIEELRFGGPGFQSTADGGEALHAQFPHLYGVLLSFGATIGGTAGLLKATAILGALNLLAIFALGTRLMSPWLSAIGTVAFGLSYPFAYFTQTATAEVPTQLFAFGGAWLLVVAHHREWLWLRLPAGLVLGAASATRIDAYLLSVGVLAFLVWELLDGRRRGAAALLSAAAGAVLTGAGAMVGAIMGWIDVREFSPFYFAPLESRLVDLRLAALATLLGGLVILAIWPALVRLGRVLSPFHLFAAAFVGLLFVGLGVYAYTLRPILEYHTQVNPPGVAAVFEQLQASAGDGTRVDGTRSHNEDAARWLGLYLGPLVLLGAIIATGIAIARQIWRPRAEWVLLLMIALPLTVLYVWKPQITPDQPWATRRFLTVSLPAASLLFAAGAGWLVGAPLKGPLRIGVRLAALLGLLVLVGTSVTQLSELRHRNLQPLQRITADVCEEIGDDATVVVHPPTGSAREVVNFLSDRYALTIRTACDVPVANVGALPPSADYDRMAALAHAQGRELVVVSPSPMPLFGPLPGEVTEVASDELRILTGRLNHRATEYQTQRFTAYIMPVPPKPGRLLDYGDGFDIRENTSAGPGRWLTTRAGEIVLVKNAETAALATLRLRALDVEQNVSVRRAGVEIASGTVPSSRFVELVVPLHGKARVIPLQIVTSPGPRSAEVASNGKDVRRLAVRLLEDVEVVGAPTASAPG